MTLIASEQDDAAVLASEDAAIRAAEHPAETPAPGGSDLAQLIERLTHDTQAADADGTG